MNDGYIMFQFNYRVNVYIIYYNRCFALMNSTVVVIYIPSNKLLQVYINARY